ncbi:hypothetical protein Avbf_09740 [Armadillidium vulgare]|nr:hypothetical protein Avbf_09740 [Armadillidium vulgare]
MIVTLLNALVRNMFHCYNLAKMEAFKISGWEKICIVQRSVFSDFWFMKKAKVSRDSSSKSDKRTVNFKKKGT